MESDTAENSAQLKTKIALENDENAISKFCQTYFSGTALYCSILNYQIEQNRHKKFL